MVDSVEPSEEDIVAFLRGRPNFLLNHPDLLEALTPPGERTGKGVSDFQQFMLKRLQANHDWLKQQQRDLIANSRANLHSINRIHAAVLLMLEAKDLPGLAQTILVDFPQLFDVDTVALLIETPDPNLPELTQIGFTVVQPGMTDFWLEDEDVMLDSQMQGDPILFGPAAPLVQSQLLLRLSLEDETPLGLIGFGSRDPLLFQEVHGTELVLFLARAVERCLRLWLEWSA